MARALAPDHDAFAVLFRRHAPAVHAFAQRRTRSRDLADDVTAASFEKAWHGLPGLGAANGNRFRPWVFRIAANEMASEFRSRSRRVRREHLAVVRGEVSADLAAVVLDPVADQLAARLDGDRVLAALDTLSPRHQEVISLRYLADLSTADTAIALGISRPHVAVVLHRALSALRARLSASLDTTGGGNS